MLKRMSFWTKIMLTFQVIGTFTQLGLVLGNSQHVYNVVVAIIQLATLIFPIWFEDKNKNDIVDVFEKEVTVKVTSDAPIQVETKTETKPPSE